MKTLREERQEEFAEAYINRHTKFKNGGILYLCPRFGKCRVAINIFKNLKNPSILIAYPDIKIKKSWEDEFKAVGYKGNITFTTHLSLHKYTKFLYDLVVIDEIHLLSEKQISYTQDLQDNGNEILGLTGTLNYFTERNLGIKLGLNVITRYSIDKAVEEGIISDYRIHIKYCKLDNKVKVKYKDKVKTEKGQFDAYGWIIGKMEKEKKDTFFLKLARMRIIQNSLGKLKATQELLEKFKNERVLVFCGLTSIADKIGCPVYHSKAGDKQKFEDFSSGKGNHMAVVKIGNTGVTYKPLNKIIINYFDSNGENLAQKINRCMAMEYGNPGKIADIYIVTTDEPVEQMWLSKALEFFDTNKIRKV